MLNSLHPRNILAIDDDQPMLLGLRVLLERNGYQITVCNDSRSAVKLAEEIKPDLIMCDIMMPVMDGFKVRDELSANPSTNNIPFLFLSARTSQSDKLRGLEDGADDYITKPFEPRELIARIEAIFRRQDKNRLEMNRQIERIKNEISQNISHELRTPLTQILLSLEMILTEKYGTPEDLKWFVEMALSQSHRLNFLIDDLTFLINNDMKSPLLLRQNVDLKNDFKIPISLRQELYGDKTINVEVHIEEGVNIHAPRREFRQACLHLVDNALKFSPPRSSISVHLTSNGHGGCILTVTDSGPGIPVEYREKVFERFFQVSQGITREYGGLGVGLTITRIIARALNGDVTILPVEQGCQAQMILPPAPLDIP